MSDILLINPPIRTWAKPNIMPLGLGYLASVLQNNKHKVEILDLNISRPKTDDQIFGILRYIKEKEQFYPNYIGIGGIITTYKFIEDTIPILKKVFPKSKIIIGGSVGSTIPHIIEKYTEADHICIGEGEKKEVLDLINGNITYKFLLGTVPIDINSIPFPLWEKFNMAVYTKNPIGYLNKNKWLDGGLKQNNIKSFNLIASRGCPYNCIYCCKDFMGYQRRQREVDNIIEEMYLLNKRYNVEYFHFLDDEFFVDKNFVNKFCEEFKKLRQFLKKNLIWGCTGRVNLVNEDSIKLMSDSGCKQICYGIESGSQKMLDWMNKKVTIEQTKNAIKLSQKYIDDVDCSFMIGYPEETEHTINETVDLCTELNLSPEVIFFITPYPGTLLYKNILKSGAIKNEREYVLKLVENEQGENIVLNLTSFTNDELYKIQKYIINKLNAQNKIKHY